MAKLSDNKIIEEEERNVTRTLSQSGGNRMKSTEILR